MALFIELISCDVRTVICMTHRLSLLFSPSDTEHICTVESPHCTPPVGLASAGRIFRKATNELVT